MQRYMKLYKDFETLGMCGPLWSATCTTAATQFITEYSCWNHAVYIQASNTFGIWTFLIQSIKSGVDVRLSKLLKLMRARDIRATGGLDKPQFLALVDQHLPHVQKYEPSFISRQS